jgi:predicted nucleic acid-binding protein
MRPSSVQVVFGTSVLVARLRSRLGTSNRVLFAVAERRCVPLVTTALFLEFKSVMLRAQQHLATGMNPADVEGFLAALASAAESVKLNVLWHPQLRDPKKHHQLHVFSAWFLLRPG